MFFASKSRMFRVSGSPFDLENIDAVDSGVGVCSFVMVESLPSGISLSCNCRVCRGKLSGTTLGWRGVKVGGWKEEAGSGPLLGQELATSSAGAVPCSRVDSA